METIICCRAIDFTASNGDPNGVRSLFIIGPNIINMSSTKSVGNKTFNLK
jgi:hypothetical protein